MRKKSTLIKVATAALVAIALVVWCISRWDTWFHNPEEAPYKAPSAPEMIMLTFGDIDGKDRNVSWVCGAEVDSTSSLDLYDQTAQTLDLVGADGETFQSRGGKAAYYVARLRNLEYGHHYSYRVCTGDKESRWYNFSMPQEGEKEVSFIYAGDIQDTIAGYAVKYLKAAFEKHKEAQFLVCGGDLTERPTSAFWHETFRSIDSIDHVLPVLTAAGNHEYLKGVICQLERRFTLVHSYYLDSKIGDNHVFTVRVGDAQLFVLDSNREFFYLPTQRSWLKEQLEASKAKWKIVVLHHPLYSLKSSTNNLIQRWMFDDVVRDNGVDLVLQAHEHAYGRMAARDESGKHTTPIYTVSHCSPKCYKINPEDRFDKTDKEGRYLQNVRTHGDTLFMTTWNVYDESLLDSVFVTKRQSMTEVHDDLVK